MAAKTSVRGLTIPPPRPTRWALLYALVFVGLPFVAALALLDLGLWWFFETVLGRCYGVFCLLS